MKIMYSIIILFCSCNLVSCQQTKEETTVYYLIRHAEKDMKNPGDKNPALNKKGQQRAKKWAKMFNNIDAVYSTNFIRTKSTAAPTAKKNNLEVNIYNPFKIDIEAFKEETKGKRVVIVGHTNTIPRFINQLLGEKKYGEIDESEYGNLYKITIKGDKISSELIKTN
ncbi:SixA phosphatase family protein [Abyssalbus ytuae]|uniref:Histidine phosphatase family protein n=1 Tax=Abyssalbus ytuae TaxID=2926907 RepID=A0A9E6ZKW8_9FLAO|nr:phosphoglycerate mutase family protein [Abyssalbus ytuae]UOB17642.1 histidine phosphatase family protein [Abyssalbus ytuae]